MKSSKLYMVIVLLTTLYSAKMHRSKLSVENYQQSLSIIENKTIKIQFILSSKQLPQPLKQTIKLAKTSVKIQYGPYFHNTKDIEGNTIYFGAITTFIQSNNKQMSPALREVLQSTFLISLSERYSVYDNFSQTIIFNDENQKFCKHHLEQIIKNILPCSVNAGLSQLIDLDSFFSEGESGDRLYGMEVGWENKFIRIQVFINIENKKIEGIRRVKINQKCLSKSKLIVTDVNNNEIMPKQIILDGIYKSLISISNHSNQQIDDRQVYFSRSIVGNWYSPFKKLVLMVRNQNSPNNSYFIINQLFSYKINKLKIKVKNQKSKQTLIQQNINCKNKMIQQSKYDSQVTLCEISLKISNTISEIANQHFNIQLYMENQMQCFDKYQSSYGGGIEFANIPIKIIQPNDKYEFGEGQHLIITRDIFGPRISLRVPQPDQSLPFQVITFTMGVFGYIWISIWRKLVSDTSKLKNKKLNEFKQKQN